MISKEEREDKSEGKGSKYFVNIEGIEYPWFEETIAVHQIRELGNLPINVPVIEVDRENNERTLAEDEIVTLKPGHGFGKKVRYKRG